MEQEEEQRMERLVEKAKQKDAEAFSLLYEMIYKDMYRMALYTMGNPHEAEDIVSETVLDAYRHIGRLRDETRFRSWIFCILSQKCKRRLRRYIKERTEGNVADLKGLASEQAELAMENILDRQVISRAFSVLDAEERMIVTMTVYGGYQSKEIGRILHKKSSTVRSRYRRALEKMRQTLEMEAV